MRSAIKAGVAVGLLTVAFACTSSDDDTKDAEDAPSAPPMTVSLAQTRSDYGSQQIGVRVTNTGDAPFTVESVRLVWSGLPESPETPKDTEFPPGLTIDLTTKLGAADCTGYPDSELEAPAAQLEVAGLDEPITAPLDDHGRAWLQRLYAGACDEAALLAVADVRLGDRWTRIEVDGTPYLRGWIELDRNSGSEPVTVTSLRGSVLLDLEPVRPGHPIGTLAGDRPLLRIPVRVGSTDLCTGHALGGSTQTFLLSAYVRHGDSEAHRVIMVPGETTKQRILDVVHDACGTS
jgi:hypothetical protein